ncbi:retropepsin-like aspartic protease family protein [Aquabacterium sp. OR-4]|uniref:retropepsin-like aspartic protease family protein n=1 Tax=Aquabacterium sp. OR-4 TaxID=2978127 RepID=UPI0021B25636|nr:retropepsin-like aspartic protease [Aquabacterium sp. OR-4]MDT7835783.1 retropepsin-like aspartic protease [Aquabacterium sp. OR-4]
MTPLRSAGGACPPGGQRPWPGTARFLALAGLGLALCMGPARPAAAQSVSLAGSMGTGRALLMIDGQPQTLAVGASARGVTLKRLGDGEAEVEVAGQRRLLRLGAAPAQVGGGSGDSALSGTVIVLPAGQGGHFVTQGLINGRSVQFVVDTGATYVALSQSEANRIGLDWKNGTRSLTQTANGTVPVHQIMISSVKIGGVEVANVRATVVPAEMPVVLLGNSFLDRFAMRRDGDIMRLEKKP